MFARPRAWEENTWRAAVWIDVALATGARLILLPELFAIGSFYAPDLLTFAEPPLGRTAEWLLEKAATHQVVIVGTNLERQDSSVYNTLLLAEPSGRLLGYQKRHLGELEARFVEPGQSSNVLDTSVGRVGCLICSDGNDAGLRESIARAKVDLVIAPQAIGSTVSLGHSVEEMERGGNEPLWGPIVREVGAPAVTAGLVGAFENPIPEQVGDYLRGGTYVIDATGRGLAHVSFPEEGIAVASVTLAFSGEG